MKINVNPFESLANCDLNDGTFDSVVEKCEERVPHSGDGTHLFLMLRVAGPACIGAVVFDHITLTSSDNRLVYYGTKKMHELLDAVGLGGVTSFESSDLIGKRVRIVIKMKDAGKWGLKPNVVAYEKAEDMSASVLSVDADEVNEDSQNTEDDNIPI